MNWAAFALVVSAILIICWLWLLRRKNWDWAGLYASLGCLIAACFNAAAPVRGVVDPNYVGYGFGLASAQPGIGVTLVAGSIFIACAASSMIAASRRGGRELWFVAATCAVMLVVIGVPTLRDAVRDPAANAIQFGEYMTIPGLVGTGVLLLLMAVPFAVGAVWAAKAAGRN